MTDRASSSLTTSAGISSGRSSLTRPRSLRVRIISFELEREESEPGM
jgi:hypothetical protein